MASSLQSFIKKRTERKIFTGLPLTLLVCIFLILLGTFVGITDSIVNSLPIIKLDENFTHFLYTIRTPFLANVFYIITSFGNQLTIAIFLSIYLVYLFFKKELAYLYSLLIIFIGTEGTVFLIKIFINRTRPGADIAYYLETSKSFPSGHSAIAAAFFGFATYYIVRHSKTMQTRSIIITLGVTIIGLIGFSRLYLGVHFLSDVIGGFLIGALWILVGITFKERHFYLASLKKVLTQ